MPLIRGGPASGVDSRETRASAAELPAQARPRAGPSRASIFGAALLTVGAELVLVIVDPFAGAAAHAIVVLLLVHLAAFRRDNASSRALLALALPSVVRLASVAMSLDVLPRELRPLAVAAVALYATLGTAFVLEIPLARIGLRRAPVRAEAITVTGAVILGLLAVPFIPGGAVAGGRTALETALAVLGVVVVSAATEELLFRGVLLRALADAVEPVAVPGSALVAATMYLGTASAVQVVVAFVLALYLGWRVTATGSLWGAALARMVLNGILLLVVPALSAG